MNIEHFAAQNGIRDEDIPDFLSALAVDTYKKYQQSGITGYIDISIGLARQGIHRTANDNSSLIGRLNNLGAFLESRYMRTGEIQDLEEAIQKALQVVERTPADYPDRAACLQNLGNKLSCRYMRTGEIKDLEEAIQTARQAIESTPADHPDWAGYSNNLGIFLESQYERLGEMKDLEEAIQRARQAVESMSDNHPDRARYLHNLGNKLGRRYDRSGEIKDLEEAIQTARQAVESMPANHPDKAACLQNLGTKLGRRYDRSREIKDLEEAILTARQAMELIPVDSPNRAVYFHNLGNRLESQYERLGEMKDLEEAIQRARQATESTPADYLNRAAYLLNLGKKLGRRYDRLGEIKDLEEAIQTARQAVESTPADHPDKAACLHNLGSFLGVRYKQTGEIEDLEEALRCLHDAWNCANALPFHRVGSAARCLKILATQHKLDAGINLGRAVLELLPTVHTRLLDRNDQQFVMSTFAGVASDLCGFFLASNRPNDALEYLEQGRAVIISRLLDRLTDLSDLIVDHPMLARQYERLVNEVNTPLRLTTHDAAKVQATERRRKAAAELDDCIRTIRGIPGHGRFLLGQTVAEMQDCAGEGSIVVVNITEFRSDAILVSRNTVKTLPLFQLSASDTMVWLRKSWTVKKRSEQKKKNEEFLGYLSWLWQVCVKQILEEISTQNRQTRGLPRVWWIGTGLASSMPFHAAGLHMRGSTESAYSKVISSYTPSFKALAHAQNRARSTEESRATHGSLLITTMPTTPRGHSEKKAPKNLPGVIKEKDEIIKAAHDRITTVVLNQPSAEQVLESLDACRIAHFACHGTSDSLDPSNSGLILQKSSNESGEASEQDQLTVHRIAELQLGHTQIAYLSACSTAENKVARLSDEVIHVVSGFQVAGFPHVVGCLWPAGDSECVEVARRFYSSILQRSQSATGNDEVASALQEAVIAVRTEDINMPLNWAQFVHYGA